MCEQRKSIREVDAAVTRLNQAALEHIAAKRQLLRPLQLELEQSFDVLMLTPNDMLKTLGKIK